MIFKKFKFIVFFLLTIFVFIVIGKNQVLNLTLTSRWFAYKQLPEDSIDILFIGNSRSFCSIDPRIIDDLLGTNSFVLGISAESIITTYYELEEAIKTQSPKYVVLESYALDKAPTRDKYYYLDFIWNIPFSIKYNNYIKIITEKESNYFTSIPIIHEHSSIWKNPITLFNNINKNIEFNNIYIQTKGFLPRQTITNQKFTEAINENNQLNLYEQNITYFNYLVELCKKNNIELIVIETPMFDKSQYNKIVNFDRKLIEKNINYRIFNSNLEFTDNFLFTDSMHLSNLGAIKYSINFSEYFSNIIKRKINQDEYIKHSMYLIEDLTFEIQNDNSLNFKINFKNKPYNSYIIINRNNNKSEICFLDQQLSCNIEKYNTIKSIDLRISSDKNHEIRTIIPIQE